MNTPQNSPPLLIKLAFIVLRIPLNDIYRYLSPSLVPSCLFFTLALGHKFDVPATEICFT